ncbi:MAG: hypothetical protein GJT30_15570 [Geobacter sp.]|nr:hypothetical protein [Geobacter sp.]
MNTLKYISVDIFTVAIIIVLGMLLQMHIPRPGLDYVLVGLACLFIGIFFKSGAIHGLTISVEFMVILIAVLLIIGRHGSIPIAGILDKDILIPLLPLIPIGILTGMVGERISKTVSH